MRSGRLEIRRLRKICQHCTKRGKQICLKMVPKKLVGLDLHSLRSVLTCRGQTCSFDLFGTSNETCPLGSLPSQYGLFEALSEMELSDDLAIGLLPDGDSLTDARYPDGFSDCGGSSSSWVVLFLLKPFYFQKLRLSWINRFSLLYFHVSARQALQPTCSMYAVE
ncbi:hypothetical protein EJB05_51210 [Eragrostis curvula]|uniref:Uncharacterized protein n=1 Tax=Eragrostis curvula TaxID=38414 RepID=A0A5J9SWH0_9POAL|nr:hypothetical protein EJB05_51210 [Eragrostis curvula]